jgi:hypothetical protein
LIPENQKPVESFTGIIYSSAKRNLRGEASKPFRDAAHLACH